MVKLSKAIRPSLVTCAVIPLSTNKQAANLSVAMNDPVTV